MELARSRCISCSEVLGWFDRLSSSRRVGVTDWIQESSSKYIHCGDWSRPFWDFRFGYFIHLDTMENDHGFVSQKRDINQPQRGLSCLGSACSRPSREAKDHTSYGARLLHVHSCTCLCISKRRPAPNTYKVVFWSSNMVLASFSSLNQLAKDLRGVFALLVHEQSGNCCLSSIFLTVRNACTAMSYTDLTNSAIDYGLQG